MRIELPLSKAEEVTVLAEDLASQTYKLIEKLPESEQWDSQSKLRNKAVELAAALPEAAGALDPRDATWRLSQARGHLAALASLAKLAHEAGYVKLDPDYMLNIKKAIAIIDEEIPALPAKTKVWMATNYPTPDEKERKTA